MNIGRILLIGAGGHARACIDVIEQEGKFSIAGLVGLRDEVGTKIFGYEVLGTDQELPQLLTLTRYALVAIGQIKTAAPRVRFYEAAIQYGGSLPTIISPRAYVSPRAQIGNGTIVMAGAVINAGATVGRNCIVNSLALIEHDAVVGDHCHISTAAVLNGGAKIGSQTFVGSNATIREGIVVDREFVVGMADRVLFNPSSREQAQ
jgi:sugar O-acyltransferase (sialic acid O-acetyltransferase NeuD family)